ncbi:MAG: DNA mismatch repair endonuclease MutL [Verrucomicrobia bacterium]|nr:DNA mismatch repair endonuclease MutL [Verrucomicrobiota bacterium]
MGRIRILPDALASQVAAGEVVDRPASVVKELVENSLDAGAGNLEVIANRGGISLIRVVDDGSGMNRDDALMCLERHATSKIRSTEDLDGIRTLGFRGEAIPSIASVSRFRLTTREKEALQGTEVVVDGGKLGGVKDAGEAPGTTVEVRSLFYNVPARRKFLRTEATEFSHLEQQVRLQAIAHPEVGFTLIHNDRPHFMLPARSHLLERIQGLAGAEIATRLLEIEPDGDGDIKVSGYIGGFGMGRSNRSLQLTFLNGRPVEAAPLNHALREGYHTALMKGQFPVVFLFLEMSPFAVDVNVHPAKKEVRFRDGHAVRHAVTAAIRRTLTRAQTTVPGQSVRPMIPGRTEIPAPPRWHQVPLIPEREQTALRNDWASLPPAPRPPETSRNDAPFPPPAATPPAPLQPEPQAEPENSPANRPVTTEDFRIIGVLGKLYVLMESAEGLVLMDQHAAHERILFEQMRNRMTAEGVPSQRLLVPVTVELAPREFDLVQQNLEALQKLGIGAEPFGANTLKIDSVPTFFRNDDPAAYMSEVVEELKRASRQIASIRLGEDLVATTVCRHAVKANDTLRDPELQRLLADLLACELPYCCPHGRPTLIQLSYGDLEKRFGRQVP